MWDYRFCRALLIQIVVMIAILLAVMRWNNLHIGGDARQFLGFTAVAATFPALLNGTRQVVSEGPQLRRDLTTGMPAGAYLASKFMFLAVVSTLQSLLLTATFAWQGGGAEGALFPTRSADVFVVLLGTSLAAVAVGLLVSTVAKDEKQLLLYLPTLIIAQIIFSGAFMDLGEAFAVVARALPSHWAFEGLASTNDLAALDGMCRHAVEVGSEPCDPAWSRGAGSVARSVVANCVLTSLYLTGAFGAIQKIHQGRF